MAINVIINGILGRMGREIGAIALCDKDINIIGGTEMPGHSAIGSDIGEHFGAGKAGASIYESIKEIGLQKSVIIDFTTPASTVNIINDAKGSSASMIIGTTGLSGEELELINNYAAQNAVLFSPNMSLGVNFLFHLTQVAAEKLGKDFDIEITEAHHRFKKDSPSGTAKRLGEIAAEALGLSYDEAVKNGRQGLEGERTAREIGMHAIRGGDIVGEHTVMFAGLGERIELKHTAHSRATFAQGAVKAAKWIASQGPGLYSMRDLLGF